MTPFRLRAPPTSANQRADWLAWSLQFAVGFFVGWMSGWVLCHRRARSWRRIEWFSVDQREAIMWGLALLLAGLASLYGDRLWLRSSYLVVPPRDIEHSKLSRFISSAACVTGGFLFVTAILVRLGAF